MSNVIKLSDKRKRQHTNENVNQNDFDARMERIRISLQRISVLMKQLETAKDKQNKE